MDEDGVEESGDEIEKTDRMIRQADTAALERGQRKAIYSVIIRKVTVIIGSYLLNINGVDSPRFICD